MAKKGDHVVVMDYTPADGRESEKAAAEMILRIASDKVEQQRSAALELKATLEAADGDVTDAEEKQYAAKKLKHALEAAEPGGEDMFGAEFFRG